MLGGGVAVFNINRLESDSDTDTSDEDLPELGEAPIPLQDRESPTGEEERQRQWEGYFTHQRLQNQVNAEIHVQRRNSRIEEEIVGSVLDECKVQPAMYVGIPPEGEEERRIVRNLIREGFTTHFRKN